MSRIRSCFEKCAAENRAAFIPFVMAGDPDPAASEALLRALPAAGADIIEMGVAFTDPMADGPAVQAAGLRALEAGQTLSATLGMVARFREVDAATPIVLMGYYNPIYAYGVDRFVAAAAAAGVDGLIVVDLPPEEDDELCRPARAGGLDFIRLATPTTDAARLPDVIRGASGFIYYVSIAGVTGKAAGSAADVEAAISGLRGASGLPIAVGFGIKTEEQAASYATFADAVVVGSALVGEIARVLETDPQASDIAVNAVLTLARNIAEAVRGARTK